jgi:hypothetical protein
MANARQQTLAGSDPPSAMNGEQHVAHRVAARTLSAPFRLRERRCIGYDHQHLHRPIS